MYSNTSPRFFKNRIGIKAIYSVVFGILSLLIATSSSFALRIEWDYRYDTQGFFGPDKRAVLEQVATEFSRYAFNRSAIIPEGENWWQWVFSNPENGEIESIENPVSEENTIRIFVGAMDLGGPLGWGGVVSEMGWGDDDWEQLLASINSVQQFQPSAGVMTISPGVPWYVGTSENVPAGYYDLYTIVLHELGHILGIGTGMPAWSSRIYNGYFFGTETYYAFGGGVPLDGYGSHVLYGTTYYGYPMAMAASHAPGTRVHFTGAEFAMLRDLGYVYVSDEMLQQQLTADLSNAITSYETYKNTDPPLAIYLYYKEVGEAYSRYFNGLGQPGVGSYYLYDGLAQALYWGYNDTPSYFAYEGMAIYSYYQSINIYLAFYYNYTNLASSWYYGYMRYYEWTGDPVYQQNAQDVYYYFMNLANQMLGYL